MKVYTVGIFIIIFICIVSNVDAATIIVCSSGCNSTTIQGGFDLANDGDTINVAAGTYNENVFINKSVNLIGAGAETTIIDASSSIDHVLTVSAGNVNITGFTLIGNSFSDGVRLYGANHSSISNTRVFNNDIGISLYNSNHNHIINDIINNNNQGLYFEDSSYNYIAENNVSSNNFGIILYSSGYNHIKSNIVKSNNNDGIYLDSSSYNTLANNSATNNSNGIWLSFSSYNTFIENTININSYGVVIDDSNNNNNNIIYHNNINNNTIQATDKGVNNSWDNGYPGGGNYWSDYRERDAEGDFIGDIPYIFLHRQDNYPLIVPFTTDVDFKNKQILGLRETTDNISWNLNRFEENMNTFFRGFYLPGKTLKEKVTNLVDSIISLSESSKQAIDNFLGNPRQPVHVESISFANISQGRTETLMITVTILFENRLTVEGATVNGTLVPPDSTNQSYSGLTDSSGQVTFEYNKKNQALPAGNYTFCVDNVMRAEGTYDPLQNAETCDRLIK